MNSTRDRVQVVSITPRKPLLLPNWVLMALYRPLIGVWGVLLLRSAITPIGACLSDDPGAVVCGSQ